MVVVPTEGYPTDGATSTRSGENEGRHRVESDEGSLQLDVESTGLSTNQGTLSVPGGQSICNQIDIPATPILQLETRPSNGSDKRLSPRLEADERIRKSSMNLVGRVLSKVDSQRAQLILIAPVWSSQPWYPKLLVAQPLRIDS